MKVYTPLGNVPKEVPTNFEQASTLKARRHSGAKRFRKLKIDQHFLKKCEGKKKLQILLLSETKEKNVSKIEIF